MSDFIKVAGAALNQTPIDWDNNEKNILDAIELAKSQGIKILCLPELCITGYGCEDLFLSKWVSEEAMARLLKIVPYTSDIAVAVGLPVFQEDKIYNVACFIYNQQILGFNAKQFLANDGVHYEKRWFTAWPSGSVSEISAAGKSYRIGDITYEIEGIKIGFEICEDAWQMDDLRPAKRYALQKTDLILNPSASHSAFGKSAFRYDLIIGSSQKFNCTYIYANLLGNEAGRIIYDGEVLIARNGQLLQRNHRYSYNNIDLISTEIDFKSGETVSEILHHDYREKEYEFYKAITLGLFDYMRKSRSLGFVLSLSGGADSSVCAVAIAEMVKRGCSELGVEQFIAKAAIQSIIEAGQTKNKSFDLQVKYIVNKMLTCAYQSSKNSGNETFDSAKNLAESLGAEFFSWSIEEEVQSYTKKIESVLGRKLTWEKDDIALQNIQARTRSPIIWMLTNIRKALLVTTSNRSEGDVGYATMDGDTSGSIAPIAGVDKHFIRQWLLWAEKNLHCEGLKYVNALTPTAELRPAEKVQTDEADLMPYDILLEIEILAIKERKPPIEVFRILRSRNLVEEEKLSGYVEKFFRLWSINQWKRERTAPSFHLDAFNVDPRSWCRFPILSGGYKNELLGLRNAINK